MPFYHSDYGPASFLELLGAFTFAILLGFLLAALIVGFVNIFNG